MAFPASPSNNQVHKEGNRAFVYDSALGVWDQVRETDRPQIPLGPKEADYRNLTNVKYPDGQVLQVQSSSKNDVWTTSSTSFTNITGSDQYDTGSTWAVRITPSSQYSKILITVSILWSYGTQGNTASYGRLMRDPANTGYGTLVDDHPSSGGSSMKGCFVLPGDGLYYYYARRSTHQFMDTEGIANPPVEIWYKVQLGEVYNGDGYTPTDSKLALNTCSYRAFDGANSSQVLSGCSSITAMEIKG